MGAGGGFGEAGPEPVAGVGGPGKDWAETALGARGGKWVPTAVFSKSWTTGLMESRCSEWGVPIKGFPELGGGFLISNLSPPKTDFKCPKKVAASFSVQRYISMACNLYEYFCSFL